jgi:D-alanyl-lipoteichoic acid acyltransferase DltB (MBOAT superfamily)
MIRFNRNKTKKVKRPTFHHSKTSKKIIIFIIISIFTFTGVAMWIQLKTGVELSPTLITCFYAFCTGELWMLASIKKSKLKTGQKGTEYQISEFKINRGNDDEPVG